MITYWFVHFAVRAVNERGEGHHMYRVGADFFPFNEIRRHIASGFVDVSYDKIIIRNFFSVSKDTYDAYGDKDTNTPTEISCKKGGHLTLVE